MYYKIGEEILNFSDGEIYDKIPRGTYNIETTGDIVTGKKLTSLFTSNDLSTVNKKYGNVDDRAKRVFETYLMRGKNTGALFSGTRGNGKTLCVKSICNMALEEDMPVLLLKRALGGYTFSNFINSVKQQLWVVSWLELIVD